MIDDTFEAEGYGLNFLWMELTWRCNLACAHCYTESSPRPSVVDALHAPDHRRLIEEAAAMGCRRIQFIGGEPTLVPHLGDLVDYAAAHGFDFIEVFTNATKIPEDLLECFAQNRVSVATSFYCDDPVIHDSITRRRGSHRLTVRGIERVLRAGLPLRVGIILMAENEDRLQGTIDYLKGVGVDNVAVDHVRSFGRGAALVQVGEGDEMSQLCGSCWRGSACISADGSVAPCIMAKKWAVGSLLDSDLADLVGSAGMSAVRRRIYRDVWLSKTDSQPGTKSLHRTETSCDPQCHPNCVPGCTPQCSPNCSPCYPYGKCNPDLYCGPCGPGR